MGRLTTVVLVVCLSTSALVSSAVPSDKRGPKDLSDEEHYHGGGEHNAGYDHEAFLGAEEAKTFDQLPPAESRRRLGVIVDKVDRDKDGSVTEQELVHWVRHVSRRYVYDDVERHWPFYVKEEDGKLSWEDYKNRAYGMVEDLNKIYDHGRNLTFAQTIERYRKRFVSADRNGDKLLDKDEFADFLHPHDVPHMRHLVIDETMTDMDKNKDGYVDLEEYINELWPPSQRESNKEPDWLESERKQFSSHRDKDGNNKLDIKEIGDWIAPLNFDPALSEAKHLIYEADRDKDKILSRAEILEHQDVFVGSQATDYGKYLVRHDEF